MTIDSRAGYNDDRPQNEIKRTVIVEMLKQRKLGLYTEFVYLAVKSLDSLHLLRQTAGNSTCKIRINAEGL